MYKLKGSLVLFTLALIAGHPAIANTYNITALQGLNSYGTSPISINNQGQMVGVSQTSNSTPHATLWSNGTVSDLGGLWIQGYGPNGGHSSAESINDLGQVVGDAIGSSGLQAVIWKNGTITELGGLYGSAASINNQGQVVGISYFSQGFESAGQYQATLWNNGTITNLGSLEGDSFSSATSINNTGQVVGYSQDSEHSHAVLWQNGSIKKLGGLYGSAASINDQGQAVGWSLDNGGQVHATFWHNDSINDLGILEGESFGFATSINNQGQVVGNSYGAGNSGVIRPTLWENGKIVDLNTLISSSTGWVLNTAIDINDSGQIIGGGTLNGVYYGFLLTPVPMPSSVWLLSSALLGFVGLSRKNKKSSRKTLKLLASPTARMG